MSQKVECEKTRAGILIQSQKFLEFLIRGCFCCQKVLKLVPDYSITYYGFERLLLRLRFSAFAAIEQDQILHFYGLEVLTMAKRVSISNLLLRVDKVDVEDFLKATFINKRQVILAPYHGGSSFSLNDISFEALEEICVYKPSSEPSPIVATHNEEEYNVKRLSFVTAGPDDKTSALNNFRDFVFTAVLENIAANIH